MGLLGRKNAIISEISKEIENSLVEEKNLERLEILEETLRGEGSQVPESLKEAYRGVAMECTVRCLVSGEDAKRSFIEAIRRIWTKRVMALCDNGSSLVTRDLKDDCQRLKLALTDEKVCNSLIEYNAKNKPLVSLKKFVSELLSEMGSSAASANVESQDEAGEVETGGLRSSASEDEAKGKEIVLVNALPELMPYHEQFSSPPKISNGRELEAEHPLPLNKTISTPVFDRVLRDLKASKYDMVKALEQAKASTLNDGIKKQKIAIANLSSQKDAPKPTLMARSSTAQTYEWEDSIDDSSGESNGDGGKAYISKRRKVVMSPLKKNGASRGLRREKVRWTTAETQAILKGYEIHGPNWKLIKEENPVLARRTNVDIKDKFRVEMRRQGAGGRTA